MANPYAAAVAEFAGSAANDAPAKSSNPYAQAVATYASDERTNLRSNLMGAQQANPDQTAEAVKLARTTGSPYEAIRANLPEVQQGQKLDAYEKMLAGATTTRKFMAVPQNADMGIDDVSTLTRIEKGLREFLKGGSARVSAQPDLTTVNATGFGRVIDAEQKANPSLPRYEATLLSKGGVTISPTGTSQPFAPKSLAGKVAGAFDRGLTSSLRSYNLNTIIESQEILNAVQQAESGNAAGLAGTKYGSLFSGIGATPSNIKRTKEAAQKRFAENVVEYVRRGGDLKNMPMPKEFLDFSKSEGVSDVLSAFGKAPIDITGQLLGQSMGQLLPTLPLMVGGGVFGGVRGLMAGTGVSSFATGFVSDIAAAIEELKVDASNPAALQSAISSEAFQKKAAQAFIKNAVVGSVDAATAGVAGVRLATGTAKNLGLQTGVQMAGGGAGEALGSVASGQEVSFNAVFSEMIAEIPGAAFDASVLSVKRAGQQNQIAAKAEAAAVTAENLTTLAEASKLRARDPESFAQFINQVAEDGEAPVDLFISAETLTNTLNQAGITIERLEMIAPVVAAQMRAASFVPGADIRMPMAEFLAAGADITTPLIDHLRASEDAMSRAETKQFRETEGERIQGEVETELGKITDRQAWQKGVDSLSSQFEAEMQSLGRFGADYKKAGATLLGNYYATQAARANMLPEEFRDLYKLGVTNKTGRSAQTLEQTFAPGVTKTDERLPASTEQAEKEVVVGIVDRQFSKEKYYAEDASFKVAFNENGKTTSRKFMQVELPDYQGDPLNIWVDSKGAVFAGKGNKAAPLRPVTAEELAAAKTRMTDSYLAVRSRAVDRRNRFDGQIEELANKAAVFGLGIRINYPDDSSSRYIYATRQDGTQTKVRIADHAQPWENGRVVGGFNTKTGVRHAASDLSIDPETKLSADDALQFLKQFSKQNQAVAQSNPAQAASESIAKRRELIALRKRESVLKSLMACLEAA